MDEKAVLAEIRGNLHRRLLADGTLQEPGGGGWRDRRNASPDVILELVADGLKRLTERVEALERAQR